MTLSPVSTIKRSPCSKSTLLVRACNHGDDGRVFTSRDLDPAACHVAAHHNDVSVGDELLLARTHDFDFNDILLGVELLELKLFLVVIPCTCDVDTAAT